MARAEVIAQLKSASRSAAIRLAVKGALQRFGVALPLPLIYVLAALTFIKVQKPQPWLEARLLAWAALPLGLVLVFAIAPLFFQQGKLRGALALDRFHGLKDRISNALAFASLAERTPLMDAAIEDAGVHIKTLSPRRAVPLGLPRELWVSVSLCALVYAVSLLELRTVRVVTTAPSAFTPLTLASDDVELLREWGQELAKNSEDPEVTAAVRRFNQLVEDIAERRLDRRQIFERLEELEQSLNPAAEGEEAALNEGLEGLARELQKTATTKPLAEALEQQNLKDAEKALKELAERLKERPSKVNKAELERVRKALEAASKQSSERLANIEQQRQALEENRKRLLNKKQEGKPLSKSEEKTLDEHERQLKRLDRQKKNAESASQELSQLDKDLAKAAEELMKEMGKGPESLEDAAQDVQRMAQKQLSKAEKEALKKQLEELRELLRQQKKGGDKRNEALERFRQMAKGQGQQPGQGQGQQGQGKGQGQGQPRIGLGAGQGAGAMIPMPGGQGPSGAQQSPGQDGAGQAPGGKEWGSDTAEAKGAATQLNGQTQDVAAAGIDSGEGSASVEVVYGAAERGFVGSGYKKVYTDYKTVAEEVMAKDEIPPGYKFYVRRYFQLIRPRD